MLVPLISYYPLDMTQIVAMYGHREAIWCVEPGFQCRTDVVAIKPQPDLLAVYRISAQFLKGGG